MIDEIEEWTRAQDRVIALVTGIGAPRMEHRVPACPDWTARDLLSHMVGLGADVVADHEPDDHNEDWTSAQVEARRDRSVDDLVAEWRALTTPLREWMTRKGTRPLGDVIIHEQDLRGAILLPGGRDTPGLRAVRDRFTGRLAANLAGGPPLALRGQRWRWVSDDGTGTHRGSDDADPGLDALVDGAPVLLSAPDFELARALVTRRSADQLRSWTVDGDVEARLGAFALLGPLPEADLTE